jgi:hypothetical protein
VQDDEEDWATESGRMKDVYKNAALCIAATAVSDGSGGLFLERDVRGLNPIKIDLSDTHKHSFDDNILDGAYSIGCHNLSPEKFINFAPLNKRAWVAQERYLSTRILHFTRESIFWECLASMTSESFPKAVCRFNNSLNRISGTTYLKKTIGTYRKHLSVMEHSNKTRDHNARILTWPNKIYKAWCGFRDTYSECGLTKDKDIFVALQGVSKDVVTEVMHDRMIAGLSESRLVEELCWESLWRSWNWSQDSHRPHRPLEWRAPSWSWASTKIPISSGSRYRRLAENTPLYERRTDMIKIVDHFIESNPSGQLVQALLWIECRLFAVKVRDPPSDPAQGIHHACFPHDSKVMPDVKRLYIDLDDLPPVGADGRTRNIYLMITHHGRDDSGSEECVEGLALMPCEEHVESMYSAKSGQSIQARESNHERFSRIGVFLHHAHPVFDWDNEEETASNNMIAHLLDEHERASLRIIELV